MSSEFNWYNDKYEAMVEDFTVWYNVLIGTKTNKPYKAMLIKVRASKHR